MMKIFSIFFAGFGIGAILASLIATWIANAINELFYDVPESFIVRSVIYLSERSQNPVGQVGNWRNRNFLFEKDHSRKVFVPTPIGSTDEMDIFSSFGYVVLKTTFNEQEDGTNKEYISFGRIVNENYILGRWRNRSSGDGRGVFLLRYSSNSGTDQLNGYWIDSSGNDVTIGSWNALKNNRECQKDRGRYTT